MTNTKNSVTNNTAAANHLIVCFHARALNFIYIQVAVREATITWFCVLDTMCCLNEIVMIVIMMLSTGNSALDTAMHCIA